MTLAPHQKPRHRRLTPSELFLLYAQSGWLGFHLVFSVFPSVSPLRVVLGTDRTGTTRGLIHDAVGEPFAEPQTCTPWPCAQGLLPQGSCWGPGLPPPGHPAPKVSSGVWLPSVTAEDEGGSTGHGPRLNLSGQVGLEFGTLDLEPVRCTCEVPPNTPEGTR